MTGKTRWLDNPENVKKLIRGFIGVCVALFLVDFVYERHGVHPWEWLYGFYAIFGFTVYVGLVLIAKWLRTFLMRSEDYYDSDD